MNSPARSIPWVAFTCLVLLGACGPKQASDEAKRAEAPANVLATIDGESITTEQFLTEVNRRGPARYQALEQRQALLDEMIRLEATASRALLEGYGEDPEIVAKWKRMVAARYVKDRLEGSVEEVTVSADEVRKHYQERAQDYSAPTRVRAAMIHIQVEPRASEDRMDQLAGRARSARREALSGPAEEQTFGALARKFSDDPATKYVGGDLGWLVEGEKNYKWDEAVVDAAFELSEPGSISPVLQTPRGFYLVKLLERQTGRLRPFEQVEAAVRHALLTERREELRRGFYDDIRTQARVEIDHARLETIQLPAAVDGPAQARKPPGMPQW
jgi:parvulin-like peptidyl-prolyl isomerase